MGWSHIPDIDSTSSNAEDNPFSAPKQQPAGKISVNLPTDDWLCRKMDKLSVTLVQGYPSKVLSPVDCSRITLLNLQNLKLNGMAYTQVRISLLDPSPSGTVMWLSSTVHIVGLPGLKV